MCVCRKGIGAVTMELEPELKLTKNKYEERQCRLRKVENDGGQKALLKCQDDLKASRQRYLYMYVCM